MATAGTSDAVWACLIAAGTVYEVQALYRRRDDDTLSRFTRRHARTHHPYGKAAFLLGWAAFAVWFARHIVRGP